MIYLDHAATTPLDPAVLQKMTPYLTAAFGNADSAHSFGREAMRGVDGARDSLAAALGGKPSEVYFTSCGSESNSWAIKSAFACYQQKGKHVVVGAAEHPSVLGAARQLERAGADVTYLSPGFGGRVSPEAVKSAVREDTVLVCLMSANNETGVLSDIPALAAAAKRYGALFFCDCTQSAPYADFPVAYADMISFSAHKFYGPKGVGALWIKSGVARESLICGGEQERGVRGGTTNVAGVVGMAAALSLAREGREENNRKVKKLRDLFEERIFSSLPFVERNGDEKNRLPSHSNLYFPGIDGRSLLFKLDMAGVAASLGSACAAGSLGASHVLLSMGYAEARALSSLRFSFGRENTEEEVIRAANAVKEAVRDL